MADSSLRTLRVLRGIAVVLAIVGVVALVVGLTVIGPAAIWPSLIPLIGGVVATATLSVQIHQSNAPEKQADVD